MVFSSKTYNCPDCSIERANYDICQQCKRNLRNYGEKFWLDYPYTTPWNTTPSCCQSCIQHPRNDGDGHCQCSLGQNIIFG